MTQAPQIAVIVPTRNESRNLPRLLKSLATQKDVTFATIVVDQESDDDTQKIAESFGARVVNRPKPAFYSPPSQSRNVGAELSTSEYIVHLDADMELPDDKALARLVALFDDEHQAVVIHEHDVAEGFWNKVKGLERDCYWNTPLESARGVSQELFAKVGGYDSSISSGEDMFIHRQYQTQTSIAASDDVWLWHHTGRMSLRRLLTKKYSYGRTAQTYIVRSSAESDAGNEWAKAALTAYVKNARLARHHPILFLSIFPLRFAELVAVRLGMRRAKRESAVTSPRADPSLN